MAGKNFQVAPSGARARGGLATEPVPVEPAWLIVEKGIRAGPYEIVIARETVRVVSRDVEAEVGCKGITLKFKLLDIELSIDDRYNTALLKRRGELTAVSNKVRYYGVVMAATDFAMFVRRSVKELIEESLAKIGL
jgi:hypothetical protein